MTNPGPPGTARPASNAGGKSRRRNASANKLRAKLPTLEAYQKELEFPAEGPGRVIVRLERLMGTDRVRLTDTKYMSTLLQRLEEDERVAWTKRRLARIKTERQRFRKLAIDGLMEPGPDMQDLIHHPVFRVNRVLNRLAHFETQMTPVPDTKLPPITEVEPFEFDGTGSIFCSYPSHVELQRDLQRAEVEAASRSASFAGSRRNTAKSSMRSVSNSFQNMLESKLSSARSGLPSETSSKTDQRESIGAAEPPKVTPSFKYHTLKASKVQLRTLGEMQQDYGVVTQKDLFREYEPHQAPLVQTVFEEDGQDLYRTAEAILEVYKCEQRAADAFVRRHRLK